MSVRYFFVGVSLSVSVLALAAPAPSSQLFRTISAEGYVVQTFVQGDWKHHVLRVSKDDKLLWEIGPEAVPMKDDECMMDCVSTDPKHKEKCPALCPVHLAAMDFDPAGKVLYFSAEQGNGGNADDAVFAANVDSRTMTQLATTAGRIVGASLSPSRQRLALLLADHTGGPDGGYRTAEYLDVKRKTIAVLPGRESGSEARYVDDKEYSWLPDDRLSYVEEVRAPAKSGNDLPAATLYERVVDLKSGKIEAVNEKKVPAGAARPSYRNH